MPSFSGASSEVEGHLFVAADDALIHFDGAGWEVLELDGPRPIGRWGRGVWAAAPDDVFIVSDVPGDHAGIWRFDGTTAVEQLVLADGSEVNAIWGIDASDVWAAGGTEPEPGCTDGCLSPTMDIWHFDGVEWTLDALGMEGRVTDVWGSGTDVWAASSTGLLRHDGDGWVLAHEVPLGSEARLGGTGPNDVWLAGAAAPPTLLHFDGSAWVPVDVTPHATDVYGSESSGIWVLGWGDDAQLLHWDGTGFEVAAEIFAGSVTLGGYDGEPIVVRRDGIDRMDAGMLAPWLENAQSGNIEAAWVADSDNLIGIKDHELVALVDGVWKMLASRDDTPLSGLFQDIAARAMDDAWIVASHTDASDARAFHFDGTQLEPVALPDEAELQAYGVHITDSGGVWILGQDSGLAEDPQGAPVRLLRLDGSTWTEHNPPPFSGELVGMDGAGEQIWLHTTGTTVMRLDAGQWTQVDRPGSGFTEGFFVAGEDDVYAAVARGDADGDVLHFDGDAWDPIADLAGHDWRSVAGSGPRDIWAVAVVDGSPEVAHFDGNAWSFIETPAELEFGKIFVAEDGSAFFNTYDDTWRACP